MGHNPNISLSVPAGDPTSVISAINHLIFNKKDNTTYLWLLGRTQEGVSRSQRTPEVCNFCSRRVPNRVTKWPLGHNECSTLPKNVTNNPKKQQFLLRWSTQQLLHQQLIT